MTQNKQVPFHPGAYILPNLFTATSLLFGFLAILWAMEKNFEWSAFAILFSAVMDGLDGQVARATHTTSEFGVQFDSLCDLVSFGIAPAFVILQWQLHTNSRLGIAVAFLFAACGAVRLARFNVTTGIISSKFFIGLPIPAAGCSIAALVLLNPNAPTIYAQSTAFNLFCLIFTAGLAFLMISRIRYISAKGHAGLKKHSFKALVITICLLALFITEPRKLGFLFCLAYICFGLIYSFIIHPRHSRKLLQSDT